jgi:hypothetical protein
MPSYIVTDSAGEVLRSGWVALESDVALQKRDPSETAIAGVSGRPGRDRYTGGVLREIEVVKTLGERRSDLIARLATRRWEVETGGVIFGAIFLATDDRSKLLIANAAARARSNPAYSVRWKMGPGSWVRLDAETLIAAEAAVYTHVQQCFAREAELTDAIDSATGPALTQLEGAIQTFWP